MNVFKLNMSSTHKLTSALTVQSGLVTITQNDDFSYKLASVFFSMGVRTFIIAGMTRQQQINLILRKDSSFAGKDFRSYSNKEIYKLACRVDKESKRNRTLPAHPSHFRFSNKYTDAESVCKKIISIRIYEYLQILL